MLLIIIESSLLNESVPFCALQEFVSPLFSIISLTEELETQMLVLILYCFIVCFLTLFSELSQ